MPHDSYGPGTLLAAQLVSVVYSKCSQLAILHKYRARGHMIIFFFRKP